VPLTPPQLITTLIQRSLQPDAINVTGQSLSLVASRGIGREVAIVFAQVAASAIAIGPRSSQDSAAQEILDEAAKAGHPPPQLLKLTLDILDEVSVNNVLLTIMQSFGCLDILINNAVRHEK
jgi:NAD(P)-dependent dehydrogenase (short-subunit alcohol dehydrogenase family)